MSEENSVKITMRAKWLAISVFIIGVTSGIVFYILFGITGNTDYGILGFAFFAGTLIAVPVIYMISALGVAIRTDREMKKMEALTINNPLFATSPTNFPPSNTQGSPQTPVQQQAEPLNPKLDLANMLVEANKLCNEWKIAEGLQIYEKALVLAKKIKHPTKEIEEMIAHQRERLKLKQEHERNRANP